MAKPTCGVHENGTPCGRPVLARGWCRMHYYRWKRHGDLFRGKPQRPEMCSLPDCADPHYAYGWCEKHWRRIRVHGNPEGAPVAPRPPDLPGEEWRQVIDYEGLYEVSSMGRIFSLYTNRILSTPLNGHGYPHLILHQDGLRETVTVHTLMAAAFLGPCPPGQMIRHLDDVKTNNILPNLEYGTDRENKEDARRNGRAWYVAKTDKAT